MLDRPPAQRSKVPVHLTAPSGHYYWMEVDIQDDPHDPRRKIFLFHDVSTVYDLRRLTDETAQFHDLIGKSAPMQAVYQQIREIAPLDSTVMIEGETGTGKELVAQAIHASSARHNAPFIAVNCAGLTDSLLSSQLFGHKKGAFTGAVADQPGFFEAAQGGTIFLDEIGDITMNVQINLLRVLQEREITRLGESTPRKIDARVIVATQHDLGDEIAKGRFRPDLLYRVRVARILLPPLRERQEDIPLLAACFLEQQRIAIGKSVRELSEEAVRILTEYTWPGNVRELSSIIEYAVIRCQGSVLRTGDLPPEIVDSVYPRLQPNNIIYENEK